MHEALGREHVFIAGRRLAVDDFGLRRCRRRAQLGDHARFAARQRLVTSGFGRRWHGFRRFGARRVGNVRAGAEQQREDAKTGACAKIHRGQPAPRQRVDGAGRLGTRSASSRRSMRANTSAREKGFFMKSSAPKRCT